MEFEEFDIEFLALKMAENPQSVLFARLADLYLGKEQSAEAMKLLEEGIKNFPEYYAGYIVLGKAHLAFKEYSRAQSAFQKAIELSPFNQTAAKLLISVPNKPDESTRTTDANYFAPTEQQQTAEPEQVFNNTDSNTTYDSFSTEPAFSEDLSSAVSGPSLLEELQAEEDARLRAEAEAGITSSPFAEQEFAPAAYAAEPESPSVSAEPFPSYDEYFAQNQSRINTQDPIALDEYLNSDTGGPSTFSETPRISPVAMNDPFTAAAEPMRREEHIEPEPVFANPEQAALFAEMNAYNEAAAEETSSEPAASSALDIDSLAEKLQSAEKIVPQENYQPQNPVPKESQDDQAYETDAVTPTLAEIYASQGEYRAAIQAYEILMFSVPAKGAEYQARIRQLQQMQMEKDGLI